MGEEAISLSSVVSRWKQKGLGRKESEEENERNTALQSNCAQKGGTSEPILECKKKKKKKGNQEKNVCNTALHVPPESKKKWKTSHEENERDTAIRVLLKVKEGASLLGGDPVSM